MTASSRILDVGIGYDILEESVSSKGGRYQVTVEKWRLRVVKLLRHSVLAEAA